eukprot:3972008-Pyramimonas_sp.AAC.1
MLPSLAHAAGVVVDVGLLDLLVGVHDEGPSRGDGLVDRLPPKDHHLHRVLRGHQPQSAPLPMHQRHALPRARRSPVQ